MLTFFDNLSATALSAKVPATWSSFFNLIFKFQCSSNLDRTLHLIYLVFMVQTHIVVFLALIMGTFYSTKPSLENISLRQNGTLQKRSEKKFFWKILFRNVFQWTNVQEIGTTRKFCTFGSVLFRPRLVYYNYLIRSLIESTSWKQSQCNYCVNQSINHLF